MPSFSIPYFLKTAAVALVLSIIFTIGQNYYENSKKSQIVFAAWTPTAYANSTPSLTMTDYLDNPANVTYSAIINVLSAHYLSNFWYDYGFLAHNGIYYDNYVAVLSPRENKTTPESFFDNQFLTWNIHPKRAIEVAKKAAIVTGIHQVVVMGIPCINGSSHPWEIDDLYIPDICLTKDDDVTLHFVTSEPCTNSIFEPYIGLSCGMFLSWSDLNRETYNDDVGVMLSFEIWRVMHTVSSLRAKHHRKLSNVFTNVMSAA